MMTFQVRLKKTRKPNQPRLRFDLEKLRDPDVACTFQATIGGKFAPLIGLSDEDMDMDTMITVQILCIGTDRSQQTVQTKIRLLLKKQSDQGLRCLPFHQQLLDALMRCYIKIF